MWVLLLPCGGGCPITACHVVATDKFECAGTHLTDMSVRGCQVAGAVRGGRPGGGYEGGWPIRKRHVSKTRDPKRISTRLECAGLRGMIGINEEMRVLSVGNDDVTPTLTWAVKRPSFPALRRELD
ncbi:hypothetical protein Tco_0957469 [Tanacetum coccineum]